MRALFLVEIARWTRTRRLLVAAFVSAFVALSSPLAAFVLPDLLASSITSDVNQVFPASTPADLLSSYFKTSSQVGLLVLAFIAGTCVSIGADDRLGLYYRSRSRSGLRVFGPRVFVATAVVIVVNALGGALALYETWALIPEVTFTRPFLALLVSAIGLTLFVSFSATLAGLTNAPFISTLIIVAVTFVGGLIPADTEWFRWAPTRLLSPTGLLGEESLVDYVAPAAVLVALVGAFTGVLLLRRLSTTPIIRRRADANNWT